MIIHNHVTYIYIYLTFTLNCIIHLGEKHKITDEDIGIIDEVLDHFKNDDFDLGFDSTEIQEHKQITFTQEQKMQHCAGADSLLKLKCDGADSIFKIDVSANVQKEIHKIPIDYLPRDKINTEHINRVFPELRYKHEEISKHMHSMTNLKNTFKQVARNKIESGYLDTAHQLGWRHDDGQVLMNKNHLFSYIKFSIKNESDLQRDLYHLTYDRFKKGGNDEIVKFVEQFMIDQNIEYYNQEKKKKNDRKKKGCFESIAFAIKTDINKKIRKYTSKFHKWYIRERKLTGEQKKRYNTEEERYQDSIVYCLDHPKNNQTVGFCFPRIPVDETMEEQNERLRKEIETLRKEGFQLRPEYEIKRKSDEINHENCMIHN